MKHVFLQPKRTNLEIDPLRARRILHNAGQHVLDVGCGDGRYVGGLLAHGYHIWGLDRVPRPYDTEVSHYLIKGDACHLPFDDRSFDTVLLVNVLEHVDDYAALREAHRVCRRNVIFSVPHETEGVLGDFNLTYHPYVDETHLRYYTEKEICATLTRAGFHIQMLCCTGPINPLGLFLSSVHVPRHLSIVVGNVLSSMPGVKRFYMNIEGVALKDHDARNRDMPDG